MNENTNTGGTTSAQSATDALMEKISVLIRPMGYEVVHLEVQSHREKTLRLFIDFCEAAEGKIIGIEDCVHVTKALDEPLDQMPEVDRVFHGASYELEVSSPGVDRPLRRAQDFDRFRGNEARIHVFRPLTAAELENTGYQSKNPKQKNFLGTLLGMKNDKVRLGIAHEQSGKPKKKGKAPKKDDGASAVTNSVEEVSIPLSLISKANIEPKFELGESE